MSDWRTARAPYATRSRLPEDDLPEIDWGAASFAPGGGLSFTPRDDLVTAVAAEDDQVLCGALAPPCP